MTRWESTEKNTIFIDFKHERTLLCNALVFYTRLPAPCHSGYSAANLSAATRYFPFIGWIVGGGVALLTWSALFLWPPTVAILLGMVAGVLLTGAFHEDGFADTCDGLGGGYDKMQKLNIMKDSRVGTYGVVGLGLLLGLKYAVLVALPVALLPVTLFAAHAMSRLAAVWVIFFLHYVREDALAKAKPIAQGLSVSGLVVATCIGVLPCLWLPPWRGLAALLCVLLVTLYLARLFRRHLGGYTGDCLGAVQQVSEVGFYLGILMLNSAP